MSEWEDELDSEPEISEEQSEQLYSERLEEIELRVDYTWTRQMQNRP